MASRAERRWLERELPALVRAGVVPDEVAERLRRHYARAPTRRAPVALFAVLGAALIGLGVILILASNWEALSRRERAGLCFALLAGAQLAAGWALWRRRHAVAWREAAPLLLMLASAAAVALVGQTYHVPGNLRSFLSAWLLPCVALPYAFDSRASAALYLAGASGWLLASLAFGESLRPYWLFLAAIAPFAAISLRQGPATLSSAFLGWVAVVAAGAGAVLGFRVASPTVLALLVAAVLGGLYGAAASLPERGEGPPPWAPPARLLTALAIAWSTLWLGYADTWKLLVWDQGPLDLPRVAWVDHLGAAAIGIGFTALAALGALRLVRAGAWPRALLAGFPFVLGLGILAVSRWETELGGMVLASAYGLALAVGIILLGVRESRIRLANAGLLLLAALVFARFSDWNLSFATRGLAFIAVGVFFLMLNLRLRRAREDGP